MEVVEQMRSGEISGILDTSMGYYILYVLPGQFWTDLSTYEIVQTDPESRGQLEKFVLSKRPQIDPLSSYLDSLGDHHGNDYEQMDISRYELTTDVPDGAILVRLRDRQWSYRAVKKVMHYMGKDEVGFLNIQVRELRRIMLMSD